VPVAVGLGAVLLALGLGAAWLAATRLGWLVALLIVASVLAYDAGLKSTWAGPEVMGACRSPNLLLGMSQATQLGGPAAWAVALAYGTFVTGITWISRSEVGPSESGRGIAAGILLQNAALLLLLAVSVHAELLPEGPTDWSAGTTAGVLVLMGAAVVLNRRTLAAIGASDSQTVQGAVKAGIFALIWLHVGVILAARGPAEALSVGWLWFPSYFTGRWVYST
jgi:4-hydroxybenzoate polyprenyltransferase